MLPLTSVSTAIFHIYICCFITDGPHIGLQIFKGHDLDLLRSCYVISHMPIRLAVDSFLWVVKCQL